MSNVRFTSGVFGAGWFSAAGAAHRLAAASRCPPCGCCGQLHRQNGWDSCSEFNSADMVSCRCASILWARLLRVSPVQIRAQGGCSPTAPSADAPCFTLAPRRELSTGTTPHLQGKSTSSTTIKWRSRLTGSGGWACAGLLPASFGSKSPPCQRAPCSFVVLEHGQHKHAPCHPQRHTNQHRVDLGNDKLRQDIVPPGSTAGALCRHTLFPPPSGPGA